MQDGQVKYAEGGTEKQRREGERGSGAVEDEWKMRRKERLLEVKLEVGDLFHSF